MSDKFLIRIAIAAFATLMLAFAAVEGINYLSPKAENVETIAQRQAPPPPTIAIRDSQTANPMANQPPPEVEIPQFNQPISGAVNASDLRDLAHQVNLKNTDLADVDKDQWKQALPKAQKLLGGACDCEQRNWLTHFIETGGYAISGSTQYQDSAKFLSTLPKDDQEATTHQISE
jgi:hypothetical protein